MKNTNNTIQAFWLALGSLSSLALTFVSAAILSRYFSKQDYGTYKQVIYIYSTLLVIFTAGLPKVFAYFLPRYSLGQGKEIVSKITKLLFISGFVFSVFLYFGSDVFAIVLKNKELSIAIKYFSPIPFFLLPTLGIEGIFSSYKKTIYIAIYNTSTRFIMLIFIVLPVIIWNGTYLNAILGWVVVSAICLLIALKFKEIPFKKVDVEESNLTLKDVLSYSLPIVGASIAGIALRSADQFFISRYYGAVTFAEFSNGFIVIPLIGMITASASTVLMPQLSQMIFNKVNLQKILNLWRSTLLKSAYLIYPIVVFCFVFSTPIIELLYSDKYLVSSNYFKISSLLNFFNIVVFAPMLFALDKTKFYANMHIVAAILTWIFEYIIVLLKLPPIAIAIFSVTMSISLVFIAAIYVSKIFNIKVYLLFPITKIGLLILHSIIFILPLYFIETYLDINMFFRIIILFIVFLLCLLATSKWFGLNYLYAFQPIIDKLYDKFQKISLRKLGK